MSDKIKVVVNNLMQSGYVYYRTMPVGDFSDCPEFTPDLTPKRMLEMGVFGGKYLNDVVGTGEYPEDWFTNAKLVRVDGKRDNSLNYFGTEASVPLADWQAAGWIHSQDPRGWFEWYCRFYMGRRSGDDQRQISRWRKFTRHLGQVKANCVGPFDGKRYRQKQALLHWSYDCTLPKYYEI